MSFPQIGRRSYRAPADTPEERFAFIRDLRVRGARACSIWTELDPELLVRRELRPGRPVFVHSETDEAFEPYMGTAFSPGGHLVSNVTPLAFVVADGDVVVLERMPKTWSAIVYERERASAR